MKKVLMFFGGVFLAIIVCVGGFFAYVAVVGTNLDKEGKEYIEKTVPVICSSFDPDTFLSLASPELLKVAPPEQIAKLFRWFKTLGQFKGITEIKGDANISVTTEHGKDVTGKYSVKVQFEAGPAVIEIVLVKRDGVWKYRLFKLDSPALMPM